MKSFSKHQERKNFDELETHISNKFSTCPFALREGESHKVVDRSSVITDKKHTIKSTLNSVIKDLDLEFEVKKRIKGNQFETKREIYKISSEQLKNMIKKLRKKFNVWMFKGYLFGNLIFSAVF